MASGTLQVDGTLQTADIQVEGGTLDGTGTINALVFDAEGGEVAPGGTRGNPHDRDVQLATPFPVTLNGPTVGQYSQLDVNGSLSLGSNTTLQLSLGYTPAPGTSFTIIKNNGTNPVNGTFAGLPECATFTIGSSLFKIGYHGNGGNDVTLTDVTNDDTWTGAGSNNLWSNPANWLSGLAPQPGHTLFLFTGTPESTFNDFPADTAFGGIQFLSPSGGMLCPTGTCRGTKSSWVWRMPS